MMSGEWSVVSWGRFLLSTHYLLFITHYLLFASDYSPFTTHHSPLILHFNFFTRKRKVHVLQLVQMVEVVAYRHAV